MNLCCAIIDFTISKNSIHQTEVLKVLTGLLKSLQSTKGVEHIYNVKLEERLLVLGGFVRTILDDINELNPYTQ